MIEREFIELAGLDAVALLDPEEKAVFAHEIRVNPELRLASAEMGHLVATVAAATTPPAALPPQALAGIYARIAPRPVAGLDGRPMSAPTRSPSAMLPWAAAAGFALIATWQTWHASTITARYSNASHANRPGAPASPAEGDERGEGHGTPTSSSEPGGVAGTTPGRVHLPRGFLTNRPGDPVVRLQQDNDHLRAEVARLQAADGTHQDLRGSGTAELSLIEMLPPGVKLTETSEPLGERAAQAMAAGMQSPAAPTPDADGTTPQGPLEIQYTGSSLGADTLISGTHLPNINQVVWSEDGQVRHLNFPPPDQWESRGLIPIDDGTVYDSKGGILWHPMANGQAVAQRPAADFEPPEPGQPYNGPASPPPTNVPAEDAAAAPPSMPDDSTSSVVPYALPVIDQQGRGTLIVQNLPPAPEGEVYQLWLRDPRSASPVNIATLQSPTQGYGHFSFQALGFVPSGYLMTREKAGPVSAPTGPVILKGPPDK